MGGSRVRSWSRPRGSILALALVWVAAFPAVTAGQSPTPVSTPGASAAPTSSPVAAPAAPIPGGLPWEAAAPPLTPVGTWLTDLTPWRHGFAAVQMRDYDAIAVWRSTDGSSWYESPLPPQLRAVQGLVAFEGGLTLIVSRTAPRERWAFGVWQSDDARHWTRAGRFVAQLPVALHGCQVNDRVVTVADGRLVAIAAVCRDPCCGVRTLPDGPASATVGLAATSQTARGGTFVWTSPTGRVWTRHKARGVADGSGYEFLPLVTRTADGLVALRFGRRSSLLRSADGTHWHDVGPLPDGFDMDALYAITASPRGYVLTGAVLVGYDSVAHIWTGTPEGTWTSTFEGDGRTYLPDVGVAGDTVIASGYRGVEMGSTAAYIAHPMILVSFDGGATWDKDASWTASADDWPLSEESCLGSMAVTIPVAVLVGCPSGMAAMFTTRMPLRPPTESPPSGSPQPDPSLAPPVTPPPGATPTITPTGPPSARVSRDGATLEMWLPSGTVASGAWLAARVRITNHRRGTIYFECGPVGVDAGIGDLFPPGRSWTGSRAIFKEQVLQRLRPIFDLIQPCPIGDSGFFEHLGPGRSRDYDLLALPRYPVADQSLPSGTLPITARFSFGTTSYGTPTHDLDAAASVDLAGPAWTIPDRPRSSTRPSRTRLSAHGSRSGT